MHDYYDRLIISKSQYGHIMEDVKEMSYSCHSGLSGIFLGRTPDKRE